MILNAALILLWINFVFLWNRVTQTSGSSDVLGSIGYLGGMLSVYGVVLVLWVYHNVRIWRRKGPRLNLREVSSVITHDALQRFISRAIDLRHGQDIRVTVFGDRKLFSDAALQQFGPDTGEHEPQEATS